MRASLLAVLVFSTAVAHAAVLREQPEARNVGMRPRLEQSLFSRRTNSESRDDAPVSVSRRHRRRRHRHV
jgi:hypothetical protein